MCFKDRTKCFVTMALIRKASPNGMLEIGKQAENNMLINPLSCMNKLTEKKHCIRDVWASNSKIIQLLDEPMISAQEKNNSKQ